jgi:hypothetical protein
MRFGPPDGCRRRGRGVLAGIRAKSYTQAPTVAALAIAAVALQHLDPVAVGIADEEETRHQRSVAMEVFDRIGVEPELLETGVLALEDLDALLAN